MKSKMTIGRKLMLGFAAVLALVLVLAITSLSYIGALSRELDIAVNSSAKKLFLSAELNGDTLEMVGLEARMGLRALVGDMATLEKYNQAYAETAGRANQELQEIRPLLTTSAGRASADDMQSGLSEWRSLHQELLALCANNQDSKAIVSFIADRVAPVSGRVRTAGDALTTRL